MKVKVSDLIAEFLKEKSMRHVFGIIGSANAHIFDSIDKLNYSNIICNHHEQASCMAIQTYYRTSGVVTAAILTAGAGSSNGITGVMSAWADSIPGMIISANENSKYILNNNDRRMYGIQGYDSPLMVDKITKYNVRVMKSEMILYELEKAYFICNNGRPGPVWIDVPMDVQSALVEKEELIEFSINELKGNIENIEEEDFSVKINNIVNLIKDSKRPVFWFGHGIRLAGAVKELELMLNEMNIPSLVSWAGIDMLDSEHPLVYGRAGVYGQRAANFVLQNSDLVVAIGTRLSIPQVGYEINEFAREAKVVVVDIDRGELEKYPTRYNLTVNADAKDVITALLKSFPDGLNIHQKWVKQCDYYREKYPVIGKEHDDKDGFINSYHFMSKLGSFFKPDQLIVTDMGTALLSGHQALSLKKGQRLMTSTGLGEMGYGLPAAIGSSFARDKGEVVCLNCDGGMMMNLQEMQTVVHHNLPVKLFIFNNDGYLMIKHTQKSMLGGRHVAVDTNSGVSCPDFSRLAKAFGIKSYQIRSWEDFDKNIPEIMNSTSPVVCEIFMHPEQLSVPKLALASREDGSLVSPPLEDLSPFISRKELEENMIIAVHEKSKSIKVDNK